MNIPEGYTYIRCDRYSPSEFAAMFTNEGDAEPSYNCRKYMKEHPKDVYTTDDEIAVLHMVAPIHLPRKSKSEICSSDDFYLPPTYDPLDEVAWNYDEIQRMKQEVVCRA